MSGTAKPFNLYLAGNILHENDQLFKNMVGLCASKFEAELCQMLQTHVKVKGVSEGEWKSLNEDCSERFMKSWLSINNDTNAYALVLIERQLFYAIVETALGGHFTETSVNVGKRKNTSVEWGFHREITEFLLNDLKESISAVATFDIAILKDAKEASHAQRIHKNRYGQVISDIFHVELAGITGMIKIEYPAILLKKAMAATFDRSKKRKTDNSRLNQLKESLLEVPLSVIGTVPMNDMSMNDLVNLKEGDFLPLPPTTDTHVSIAGVPFFHADLIEQGGRLALEISQSIRPEQNALQV